MTSEQIIKELDDIIPELEKDGLTDSEIEEYIECFIIFNREYKIPLTSLWKLRRN